MDSLDCRRQFTQRNFIVIFQVHIPAQFGSNARVSFHLLLLLFPRFLTQRSKNHPPEILVLRSTQATTFYDKFRYRELIFIFDARIRQNFVLVCVKPKLNSAPAPMSPAQPTDISPPDLFLIPFIRFLRYQIGVSSSKN